MSNDPYEKVAGLYDRLFEPMNRGLRGLGLRMFTPPRGGSVLDVGCGTGVHLEMYREHQCSLFGIDASRSMLDVARARLGPDAELRQADAAHMPHDSNSIDLIICMLVLHEMDDRTRMAVLGEMDRVIKPEGRVLLIDFHAGRSRPIRGWFSKLVIVLSEIAAGRRHFRNYRHFVSIGGLPNVIDRSELSIEKTKIVGHDTMALYLLRPA